MNWVVLRGGILMLFWSAILYWIGFSMLRPMMAFVLIGSLVMMLSGGVYLLGGMMHFLWPILVGQLLNGVGSLLSWGALQASAAIASNEPNLPVKKEHLLPNFAFVNSLAQFSGPIVGGLLADTGSFLLVFAAFIGIGGLSTVSALFLPKLYKNARGQKELTFRFWKSYSSGLKLIQSNRPL